MAVKIRLARRGRKKLAMFDVVVADARAPRDGRFVEKIGTYNPNTNPATVVLNEKQAIQWVLNGAQPTDTVRAILSYKGVMYKKHLEGGVKKGALTAEQAEAKFAEWLQSKEGKIEGKKDSLTKSKDEVKKAALAAEAKKKEDIAAAIVAKNTPAPEVVEEEEVAEEVAETPEVELAAEEVIEEAPVAEVLEQAPAAEEVAEAPAPEAAEESPESEEKA